MISFYGVYTRKQFFRGVRLARRLNRRAFFWRGLSILIVLIVVGAFIAIAVAGEEIPLSRLIRTGFTALLLLYWAISPFIGAWLAASRQWRKARGKLSLQGAVTDQGIVSNAPAPEAVDKWESFLKAYVRDDLVVLVGADGMATILPRAFFADDNAWAGFCQMVDFKVVRPK